MKRIQLPKKLLSALCAAALLTGGHARSAGS